MSYAFHAKKAAPTAATIAIIGTSVPDNAAAPADSTSNALAPPLAADIALIALAVAVIFGNALDKAENMLVSDFTHSIPFIE